MRRPALSLAGRLLVALTAGVTAGLLGAKANPPLLLPIAIVLVSALIGARWPGLAWASGLLSGTGAALGLRLPAWWTYWTLPIPNQMEVWPAGDPFPLPVLLLVGLVSALAGGALRRRRGR
jgi:hypothetical protein